MISTFIIIDDKKWIWNIVINIRDMLDIPLETFMFDMELSYKLYYFIIDCIYYLFFFIFNRDSLGVLVFLFILFILLISLFIVVDYIYEFLFEKKINEHRKIQKDDYS